MKNAQNSLFKWLTEPATPPQSWIASWLKMTIIIVVSLLIKAQPTHPTWAVSMILLGAWLLVPMGFQQFLKRMGTFGQRFRYLSCIYIIHFVSVLSLSFSFTLEQGAFAGMLAVPYALWCFYIFIKTLKWSFNIGIIAQMATWGFLTNAAVWCVFDRLNYQPIGFSPWIVLLTGAHFHYAGFALMASLTLFYSKNPNDVAIKNCIRAVLLGVILTAVGITTTQLGHSILIESIAGIWMALSGFCVGCVLILRGWRENAWVKKLWLAGGFCLVLGMTLALGYALRHFVVIDWLSIPHMQAVHGTLNALGFGTLTLIGWLFHD